MTSWSPYDSIGAGCKKLENSNALLTFGKQQNLLTSDIEFGGGVGLLWLDELDRHSPAVVAHVNGETNSNLM